MNQLPQSWYVAYKDIKDPKYFNSFWKYVKPPSGVWKFYGKLPNGTFLFKDSVECSIGSIQLTWAEFVEMTTEWIPKRGEMVEVSNINRSNAFWDKRIYLTTLEGNADLPYVCVENTANKAFQDGVKFSTINWKFIRQIFKKDVIEVTVKVNGCETSPAKMSEADWLALRSRSEQC